MSLRESIRSKPLPLKQRTSSVDARRDFSEQTWISLLRLVKLREFFITVDNFSIWRRHLAWANPDGDDLRTYMTQRYAASMVFMSLLLGAELGVLFNSNHLATKMRQEMLKENAQTVSFWVGILILVSVILTILSLISTFTAWGMVSAISGSNAHCILRSSIGQYVAELPGRLIVVSLYSFLLWVVGFIFMLLPIGFWSSSLILIVSALFMHIVAVFSAFGRLIMHTGAMGSERIFESEFERSLLPHSLHANLLTKATAQLENKTSIMRQYRFPPKPLSRTLSVESLISEIQSLRSTSSAPSSSSEQPPKAASSSHTQGGTSSGATHQPSSLKQPGHKRTDSAVRFADNLLTGSSNVKDHSVLPSKAMNTIKPETPNAGPRDSILSTGKRGPRPKPVLPPRPRNLKSPTPDSNTPTSHFNSGTSVASIEEWLQGSPSASPNTTPKGTEKSIKAFGVWDSGKPLDEKKMPSSLLSSSTHGDGTKNTDSVDDDDMEPNASEFAPPAVHRSVMRFPRTVTTQRTLSEASSIACSISEQDGSSSNQDRRRSSIASVDERFFEEYGEMFDPETGAAVTIAEGDALPPPAGSYYGLELDRGDDGGETETRHLLANDGLPSNSYSAVTQTLNQEHSTENDTDPSTLEQRDGEGTARARYYRVGKKGGPG